MITCTCIVLYVVLYVQRPRFGCQYHYPLIAIYSLRLSNVPAFLFSASGGRKRFSGAMLSFSISSCSCSNLIGSKKQGCIVRKDCVLGAIVDKKYCTWQRTSSDSEGTQYRHRRCRDDGSSGRQFMQSSPQTQVLFCPYTSETGHSQFPSRGKQNRH